MVSKLTEIWSGLFIPDPDPDFLPISDPGSKGQKGTVSRIFDPDPQLWNQLCRTIGWDAKIRIRELISRIRHTACSRLSTLFLYGCWCRNAGEGAGLEPQVQVLRSEEDLRVRAGRGRRHDRHPGPPGPEHQVNDRRSCSGSGPHFRFFSLSLLFKVCIQVPVRIYYTGLRIRISMDPPPDPH